MVGIIIIPEGHPRQNGNEMAAMMLTYPPMYCPFALITQAAI